MQKKETKQVRERKKDMTGKRRKKKEEKMNFQSMKKRFTSEFCVKRKMPGANESNDDLGI